MNVYDFDGTIYPSNSTVSFGLWCMVRQPGLCLTFGPRVLLSYVRYKLGRIPNYRMQRELFRYLMMVRDFDVQIERFWDVHQRHIASWYLAQKRPDDLIISSSPACILEPMARRLGVRCVATNYDREMGVFVDNLMYAKEKAKYIFDHGFPMIDNFYSDSLADTPLALCAEKAHLVTNHASTVIDWPELDENTMSKVREKIDTGWDIHLKE